MAAIAALVRQGEGIAGRNTDYVRNTHGHLKELGITDPALERIVALLAVLSNAPQLVWRCFRDKTSQSGH